MSDSLWCYDCRMRGTPMPAPDNVCGNCGSTHTRRDAADTIERLTRERDDARAQRDRWIEHCAQSDDIARDLAEALETTTRYAGCHSYSEEAVLRARAALARYREAVGGGDDGK